MKLKGQKKFYIILVATVILGVILPGPGAYIKQHGWIIDVLIALMYLGIGISVDTRSIIAGISRWRQILYALLTLFVITPLMAYAIYLVFLPYSSKEAMIGLMFISALATTISSGIMLTEGRNGNCVLSMYNVVFSQILGVFVAPLVIAIVLRTQFTMVVSLSSVMWSLIRKMIFPFVIGQCLYRFRDVLGKPAKFVSNNSIYVILYGYIGYANASGYLTRIFRELAVPFLSVALLCLSIVFFVIGTTKLFRWNYEDRVSLLFTCTMKTMSLGIPMAVLFFPDDGEVTLNVSLLIIIYYCLSMFISLVMSSIFLKPDSSGETA